MFKFTRSSKAKYEATYSLFHVHYHVVVFPPHNLCPLHPLAEIAEPSDPFYPILDFPSILLSFLRNPLASTLTPLVALNLKVNPL